MLFDVDLPATGAPPAGGVPLSEALPYRLGEDGALRAAARGQAARV